MVALPPLSIANSRMLGLRWIPNVAETGGGRCARYARGNHAGCERRASRAERRQSRTDGTSGAIIRKARQKARPVHSKEPQWDIQDYRKGEGRFASVAK